MSRAFSPPDNLSKEEIRTIADVRRDIWTNGFLGLGYGSIAGIAIHKTAQYLESKSILKFKKPNSLNKNTAFFSFMAGGALGSFAFATAAGKNKVHHLHGVMESNKQKVQQGNVASNGSLYHMIRERHLQNEKEEEERISAIRERKLLRRKTLHERLGDDLTTDVDDERKRHSF